MRIFGTVSYRAISGMLRRRHSLLWPDVARWRIALIRMNCIEPGMRRLK